MRDTDKAALCSPKRNQRGNKRKQTDVVLSQDEKECTENNSSPLRRSVRIHKQSILSQNSSPVSSPVITPTKTKTNPNFSPILFPARRQSAASSQTSSPYSNNLHVLADGLDSEDGSPKSVLTTPLIGYYRDSTPERTLRSKTKRKTEFHGELDDIERNEEFEDLPKLTIGAKCFYNSKKPGFSLLAKHAVNRTNNSNVESKISLPEVKPTSVAKKSGSGHKKEKPSKLSEKVKNRKVVNVKPLKIAKVNPAAKPSEVVVIRSLNGNVSTPPQIGSTKRKFFSRRSPFKQRHSTIMVGNKKVLFETTLLGNERKTAMARLVITKPKRCSPRRHNREKDDSVVVDPKCQIESPRQWVGFDDVNSISNETELPSPHARVPESEAEHVQLERDILDDLFPPTLDNMENEIVRGKCHSVPHPTESDGMRARPKRDILDDISPVTFGNIENVVTNEKSISTENDAINFIDEMEDFGKENSVPLYPLFTKQKKKFESTPERDAGKKSSPKTKQLMRNENKKNKRNLKRTPYDGMEQLVIDVGQKEVAANQCTTCGMVYTPCDPEDSAMHDAHHNTRITRLAFMGWKKERIMREFHDGRVILILPLDAHYAQQKLADVWKVLDSDLGELPLKKQGSSKFFVFVSTDEKKIIGLLAAESVRTAYRVIPDGGQKTICCESEGVPALCGISRLWTLASHRKMHVATRLLDCLRENFVYGYVMTMDDIAFSGPTSDGAVFASRYTGTEKFLVYK